MVTVPPEDRNCAQGSDGRGYTRVFPALGGNPVVQGTDATSLIYVLLSGSTLAGTKTAPSSFTMPAFGWRLSDQEVADVSNFVRNSWGNTGSTVSASDVAKIRKTVAVHAPEMPRGASLGHWGSAAPALVAKRAARVKNRDRHSAGLT
ncbi:MAG: alcohol dehydrogenase (quinone), cytochrome c subunit [Caballeronia mineralivorans]|nr:alcohol dehydrogenase (quinone), cytochrome c subunit [Caballeronia mineralivorans]